MRLGESITSLTDSRAGLADTRSLAAQHSLGWRHCLTFALLLAHPVMYHHRRRCSKSKMAAGGRPISRGGVGRGVAARGQLSAFRKPFSLNTIQITVPNSAHVFWQQALWGVRAGAAGCRAAQGRGAVLAARPDLMRRKPLDGRPAHGRTAQLLRSGYSTVPAVR